ncbi:4-hydroxybenzoate 3-monooxygenase [Salinarimonas chemoclinalis]|uniref:4-hydroxybenzoate 3-monooxygenase n=1 Tax=Salinarimonas chemoclinalis TaxID=3241599 RepID=UPI0035570E94
MAERRVQVGIVGAGPAGLLLSHLLHLAGISSVVVEAKSRAHIEGRIRAGVLEQGTVDVLRDTGMGARMDREGLLHHGTILKVAGEARRIDFQDLVGKSVMVYGQHEVVKDLVAARLEAGGEIVFEASQARIDGVDGDAPTLSWCADGARRTIACDFVAGCDGFHGISRSALPADVLRVYERVYPFGWLGILARTPPASEELIYAHHDRGFALLSMRSPEISRLYLQCPPDEDIAGWTDARIWEELQVRLAGGEEWRLDEGEIVQKGVTAMRSFVAEPMRHGRLFLAGDAAHIVPPTGAKGMNLAVGDVRVLARALESYYSRGREEALAAYSDTCLRRIWAVQRFSWWMTQMLHTFDDASPFDRRRQLAELDYVTTSRAAMITLAENYVGLPMDWGPA